MKFTRYTISMGLNDKDTLRPVDVYEHASVEVAGRLAQLDVSCTITRGTELAMVLNWKSWEHAEKNPSLSKVYSDLYYKLHDYILDNWKDEDLEYYLSTTD